MSKEESKKVHVICPICRAKAVIPIPTYIFHRNQNGIANIQIQPNDVCDHQFLLSIDQHFNVRGTEKIDFQLKVAPQRENITELTCGDVLSRLKSNATTCLIHAIIFGYPIQIVASVIDPPEFYQQLLSLAKSLLPMGWHNLLNITQISKKEFQNLPQAQEDSLVIDTKGIVINTPWVNDKMAFEESLLVTTSAADTTEAQLDVVKYQIQSLYTFVQTIAEFIRGKDLIYETEMERYIEKKTPIKKPAGFLQYMLKLVDRRCPNGKCLVEKVHVKSVDSLKTLWL
jgi:hypothetical protein